MRTTCWINCKTPPVHRGDYDVRLRERTGEYTQPFRCTFAGQWLRNGHVLTGASIPGWHEDDEWRGVVRPNAMFPVYSQS